jgi:acetolactate synthase I/II/III large subunit
MKVFEAVTTAVASEGFDHLFAVMGDANQDMRPGYTNATTSLICARLHRTPLLLLAGHASLPDPYNPQGMVDQHELAKLTTEATVKMESAKTVDYCLGEAFRRLKRKTGPFILNMPQDIQQSEVADADGGTSQCTNPTSCSLRVAKTSKKPSGY